MTYSSNAKLSMPLLSFISIYLPPIYILSLTQVVMNIRIHNIFYQHEFLQDPGIKFPFVVLCGSRLQYFDYCLNIWHGRKNPNDYIIKLEYWNTEETLSLGSTTCRKQKRRCHGSLAILRNIRLKVSYVIWINIPEVLMAQNSSSNYSLD